MLASLPAAEVSGRDPDPAPFQNSCELRLGRNTKNKKLEAGCRIQAVRRLQSAQQKAPVTARSPKE